MLIIAHRGASHDAPENTLAAVRLAWAQHADAVEVDVHLTRDGRLAVIHDPDTQRVAGAACTVADSTLAELQALDLGTGREPRFAGERIPVLEEVFALVPAGKRVFVELKGGPESVPALRRSVAQAVGQVSDLPFEPSTLSRAGQRPALLAPAQIAVIAFDLATAIAAKLALPEHEVCWLAEAGEAAPAATLEAIARIALDAGLDGIDVDAAWLLDAAIVQRVQQMRGGAFKVYVWTVDDAPRARGLAATGIAGLTTNRPGWLRAQLGAG